MNEPKKTLPKPVDWDQLYPGRFLKAGELLDKKPSLTIASVDLDELEGDDRKKKIKGVISFEETPRQLALNKINGTCLREMFGRKVQAWVGKRVTLFKGEWNGEDCIRIWGSKDISSGLSIVVELSRRKPIPMRLHKVPEAGTPPRSAPHEDDVDPDEQAAAEEHFDRP
jgi:hypothetical protein